MSLAVVAHWKNTPVNGGVDDAGNGGPDAKAAAEGQDNDEDQPVDGEGDIPGVLAKDAPANHTR